MKVIIITQQVRMKIQVLSEQGWPPPQ